MTTINTIRSNDKTSQDIPLSLTLDETQLYGDDYIYLYGTISNTSQASYYSVSLILTIRDQDGKYLSRSNLRVNPDFIRPGEVGFFGLGYINTCPGCSKKEAITIENNIMGKKKSQKQVS